MAVLDYNIAVTGDCSNNNSGAFNLYVSGGTPPYTVQFVNPVYFFYKSNRNDGGLFSRNQYQSCMHRN